MSISDPNQISEQYQSVLEKIAETAVKTGRIPDDIKLVVVTKGHEVNRIRQVIDAGAKRLGENYAEEGIGKINQLKEFSGIEWHMIGHVQSRKAEMVVQNFDIIHSLDNLKIAERYEQFAGQWNKKIPVLLECNVSGEESKFGFSAWDSNNWDKLLYEIKEILNKPHLDVCGLMTMAPYFDEAEKARPIFQRLVEFQKFLKMNIPQNPWKELSMGMSSDYSIAIEEGATMVRIGQAILGPRNQPKG